VGEAGAGRALGDATGASVQRRSDDEQIRARSVLHQGIGGVGALDELRICRDAVVCGEATGGIEGVARSRLPERRLGGGAMAHDVGDRDEGDVSVPGQAERLLDGGGGAATAVDAADDVAQGDWRPLLGGV
jgi:hypothetical protein